MKNLFTYTIYILVVIFLFLTFEGSAQNHSEKLFLKKSALKKQNYNVEKLNSYRSPIYVMNGAGKKNQFVGNVSALNDNVLKLSTTDGFTDVNLAESRMVLDLKSASGRNKGGRIVFGAVGIVLGSSTMGLGLQSSSLELPGGDALTYLGGAWLLGSIVYIALPSYPEKEYTAWKKDPERYDHSKTSLIQNLDVNITPFTSAGLGVGLIVQW